VVKASSDAFAALTARVALDPATTDVLDIGCGTGLLSLAVAPRARSVVGVDVASGMVAAMRAKITAGNFANAEALELLLDDPGRLGGRRFDLALCHLALHHLPDLSSFFAVVFALLKPGGRVFFTDFAFEPEKSVRFHDPETVEAHGVHRHGVDPAEICTLLEAAGLVDVKAEKAFVMSKPLPHEGGAVVDFDVYAMMGSKPLLQG
ncbi:hypothetical protein HK405_015411, partial [Cladochytrium tenue]